MSAVTKMHEVAVIGAGMVGLSTAWFLQERGVEVTVYDRTGVAAGSSWGNAGWLTPSIATPLPDPAVLRYGLRALLSPSSPVYVPPTPDPRLLGFLTRFARSCTQSRWRVAMQALIPVNTLALGAFADLREGGVGAPVREAAPFLAAYRTEVERRVLLEEIEHIRATGQQVSFETLTGAEARALEPALSPEIGAALSIHDEQFVDPAGFVHALGRAVEDRGGKVVTEDVRSVGDRSDGMHVNGTRRFDAVVLASGAHLSTLARPFGVRIVVQAGRGYSFTVATEHLPRGPVYFPAQRVACTPVGDRLRVAGMMEFRPADAPRDPRRIRALVDAASPLLVGATRAPRVFAAGGHGMWGMTLGPITGKLLAEQVVTGRRPRELAGFDPLR